MSVDNGYAEEKQTTAALKDGEHEKIDFSKLTFNKPGTYMFAINELARMAASASGRMTRTPIT